MTPEEAKLIAEEVKKIEGGFWARINHPVFGVFISAWLIWNWEVPYNIIGGIHDPQFSINRLNLIYLNWNRWIDLIAIPSVSVLGFVTLGPLAANLYLHYQLWVETKRKYYDSKTKGEEPITKWEHDRAENERNRAQMEASSYRSAYYYLSRQPEARIQIGPIIITNGTIEFPSGGASESYELPALITRYIEQKREIQNTTDRVSVLQAEIEELRRDRGLPV